MPYPGELHPEPLPLQQLTTDHITSGDIRLPFWLSLFGVSGSWYIQGLFEPSEHLWWVWGLILIVVLPLLLSCWGFSFALGCGVSFYGGIQHFLADGCSAASCNLVFSQEKMSTGPSTPPLVPISSCLQVILHRTFVEHKHPEGKDILLFFNISLLPFQHHTVHFTGN